MKCRAAGYAYKPEALILFAHGHDLPPGFAYNASLPILKLSFLFLTKLPTPDRFCKQRSQRISGD
jgi:hypothetical protein